MENRDIAFNIFQFLKIEDIKNCSTTNKLIHEICDIQYKRLLISDYGSFFCDNFILFKQSYIKCYYLHLLWKKFNAGDSLINFFLLTKIKLSNRKIEELPATIGQLVNLRKLWLSDNQIKELPATIGQLSNLQELWLDNNQIKELPTTIGQLVNLQNLWLSDNQIKELPAAIGQLVNLQKLSLSSNKIKELPATIGQLVNCQIYR